MFHPYNSDETPSYSVIVHNTYLRTSHYILVYGPILSINYFCLLACMLLGYWPFISTCKPHFNVLSP